MTHPQNRKTNLGILLLLTGTFAFGVAALLGIATLQEATTASAFRFGVAGGIALCGGLALITYSVLVIRKGLPQATRA